MPQPTPLTGLPAVLAASRATSAGGLRGRRLWGVMLLAWLPLVLQTLLMAFREETSLAGFNSFVTHGCRITVQTVAPVILAFLGTGAFSDEWSLGTSHYVTGLPLSRTAIVLGRWLRVLRAALLIVLPPVVLSFFLNLAPFFSATILAEYLPSLLWVLLGTTLLVGAMGALFVLFGLLLRRPLMTALVYVFVFEMAGGFLPPSLMSLSLNAHVRNILWQLTDHDGFLGPARKIWTADPASMTSSLAWLMGALTLGLGLSVLRLRAKESGDSSAAAGEDTES